MKPDIIKQLKAMKTDPAFGALSQERKAKIKEKVFSAIRSSEFSSAPSVGSLPSFSSSYFVWNFTRLISTPVSIGAFVFVLVMGGGLSTVSAASTSLPGDTFYGLKRVSEQARLKMASLEDRAVLHTEFAGRRLEEAKALSLSADPIRLALVPNSLSAYKSEVSQAESSLRELSNSGSAATAATANAIDQKLDELSSALSATEIDTSQSESEQVVAAQDATESASDAVVDVLVDTHEAAPETSHVDVEQLFRNEFAGISKRQTFDLGRLAMIRKVLSLHPELKEDVTIPDRDTLIILEHGITTATDGIPEAMDLLVAGGTRDAFEQLSAASVNLKQLEIELAQHELAVMSAVQKESEEPKESEESEAVEIDKNVDQATTPEEGT